MCLLADPASDSNITDNMAERPTLSPITTQDRDKPKTRPISPSTVTQPWSTSTAILSTPDLRVNSTPGTDVIRYGFQVFGGGGWFRHLALDSQSM